MALRNLATKMRTPAAAAALRLTPAGPRASLPPAGTRRRLFTYYFEQGKQHAKRIDLESASPEEIVREANLLKQKAEESMECVRKESEKVPLIMKDVWRTAKLSFGAFALTEIFSFTAYLRQEIAEPDD